jgi:hypothetical protein
MRPTAAATGYRNISPQSVSATLRRYGLRPVPRDRDGLHVNRSHRADVVLVSTLVRHLLEEAVAALTTAGYECDVADTVMHVRRAA